MLAARNRHQWSSEAAHRAASSNVRFQGGEFNRSTLHYSLGHSSRGAGAIRPLRAVGRRLPPIKRFQTIHHYSVDVAHGLVLLFGITMTTM